MNHSTLSRKALTTLLIGAYIGMLSPMSTVHAIATITEVTPIPTYTTNQSPTYIFNSSTGGTIGYTGPCAAMLPSITTAMSGDNTITFGPLLSDNNYSTGASICGFTVDDGEGASNILNVPWFAVDNTIPTISVSNSDITINRNDSYLTGAANWADNFPNGGGPLVGTGFVDNTTVGVYTLTFDYTDAAGNMAVQRTRTIRVVNGAAPVLTLVGPSLIQIASGSTYTELGATYTDAEDDASGSILTVTISGSVDTSTAGSYTLTYNVTDTAGNAATPITRNVNVLNGDLPIITLSGSATVLHEQGVTYVDQGATGNDVQDGPVISTANIIASGTVLWGTGGTYTIDYNLTDSNSNPAVTVTRTVIVADRTAPVITMSGSNTVSITKDGTYIDAGATWTDLVDGSGAAIRNSNVNTSIVGTYTVTYDHIDAAGNTGATITRTVQVVTGGIPTITLNGSGTVNLLTGSGYTESGATAFDVEDGSIASGSISISGSVNTNVPGTYTISYNWSDSQSNPAPTVTRTVNVLTGGIPVISLIGSGNVTILYGYSYIESGATAFDIEDGDLTSGITISGSVNGTVPGVYPVEYTVSDSNFNTGTITRTVNVIDIVPPVVTLIGSGDITINAGSTYTDSGAYWTDNIDGSGFLLAQGSVNTSVAGLYVLSYNYTDSSGNSGTLARRNVTVAALASVPFTGMVGGGGGAGAGSTTYGANFNSAPSTSSSTSEDALIPSITRLLKRSLAIESGSEIETNSATDTGTNETISTLSVIDPVTDYICPVVEKLYDADNQNIQNVSEGEYTQYVQSLLMYRGLDNDSLSDTYTERYFVNKGFGIAKLNEAYDGERAITRAEFVKMLVRALSCHYTLSDTDSAFTDVGPNAWYTEYVNFATENGWISGYANGTFGPHNLISRGEMAKILGQAIQIQTDENATAIFKDVPVDSPYAPYIYALMDKGLFLGKTESYYDLNSTVTRNEVAKIFSKTFLNVE